MQIQRLIFDTTYILPLFGIKITDLSRINEGLKIIWEKGIKDFELYIPTICLIEVLYKLMSEYRNTNNYEILKRYPVAIPTIMTSQNVNFFDPHLNSTASQIALLIRHSGHIDIMDCLIAASAAALNGILLTEDNDLKNRLQNIPETKVVPTWSWNELVNKII